MNAFSIEDLRQKAKRHLPKAVFDMADGGAEDEKASFATGKYLTAFILYHACCKTSRSVYWLLPFWEELLTYLWRLRRWVWLVYCTPKPIWPSPKPPKAWAFLMR